jgi:2-polyprenyl-3-methyl-5-hydroxy-6-metoxy-1,4-benzoquinol methylase
MQNQKKLHSLDLSFLQITPDIRWAFATYRRMAARGEVGANHVRANDYKRWSAVYSMLDENTSLIDVGIGAGQFVNAAAKSRKFKSVIGVDCRQTSGLKQLSKFWTLVIHDLTSPYAPPWLKADVVTCMETVEHINQRDFARAIGSLKSMAQKRLIVTVPFEEPLPLAKFHKQRFDRARLLQLFPSAQITVLTLKDQALWAVIDEVQAA